MKDKSFDKEGFSERLYKACLEATGLKQKRGIYAEIARRCNTAPQSVADWLDPEKGLPSLAHVARLAKMFNVSLDYLIFGDQYQKIVQTIPILDVPSALLYPKILPEHEKSKGDSLVFQYQEWVDFALRLPNDSMLNPFNLNDSFPKGALLLFQSHKKGGRKPHDGAIVFAKISKNNAICARYIACKRPYLQTLNPNYDNFKGNFQVLAHMVAMVQCYAFSANKSILRAK